MRRNVRGSETVDHRWPSAPASFICRFKANSIYRDNVDLIYRNDCYLVLVSTATSARGSPTGTFQQDKDDGQTVIVSQL
ncbi:MAG TPA: hypothetical protein VJ453_13040 [Terriglobales bacterium]|nr:hypothetical protein [Terriglobales bacterium]